jgi:hypothetical protein
MKRLLAIFTLLFPAASVQAGFLSGQSADLVLGGIEPAGLLSASDIAVDPVSQKVFVADAGRHRVLRFSSAASLQNGLLAKAVFGAADMYEQVPGTSATQLNAPEGVCADSGGRLWVADSGNNQVLRFDNALTAASGAAAAVVLGQPNFSTSGFDTQSNRMRLPRDVEIDSAGRLWVADSGNKRVLKIDNAASRSSGVNADGVLLQPNFTSNSLGVTASVSGLSMDSNGTFYLSRLDRKNAEWHFNAASKPNGSEADGAFGDATRIYTTNGGGSRPVIDPFSGRLWVGSSSTVMRFTPDLTSRITQAGFNAQNRLALTINGPQGEIYDIRSSADLLNWDTIKRTDNMSASGVMSWTASTSPTGPARFYRLQVP